MDAPLIGLGDLLIGSMTVAVGTLALLISLVRFKRAEPLLAAFGAFALLYGVRLIFSSELISAMGILPLTAAWMTNTITYVINIPAWIFFFLLLGHRWRSMVFAWLGVISAFAVVGIVSDLVQQTPGTLARRPNNMLVLIGLVILLVAFSRHRGRLTTELRILLVGLSTFGLFAANDNLVSMSLVPWTWQQETIGFVIFVGCLGYVAARRSFLREGRLAALEGELETARQIQTSLLPGSPPELTGLSVATRFQPSSAVAGDLYDFLSFDEPAVGILVADVSGHGVPAALIASMVKVTTASHMDCADRPAEFLARINQTLCNCIQRGFVTAAYVYLDCERGEVAVASAGHPPPILVRGGGQEILEVGGQGPILGRFPPARYEEQRLPLAPGDRLILYTDGLTEAQSTSHEMFGEHRLHTFAVEQRALPAEEFCDALIARLHRWAGSRPRLALEDDMTLLVVDLDFGPNP